MITNEARKTLASLPFTADPWARVSLKSPRLKKAGSGEITDTGGVARDEISTDTSANAASIGLHLQAFRFTDFHTVQYDPFIDADSETTDWIDTTPDFVLEGRSTRTEIRQWYQ